MLLLLFIKVCRISIIKIILINIYYVPDTVHILAHLISIQGCQVQKIKIYNAS